MYLLILCAATTGCGTSAKPRADSERLAAAEKEAAQGKEAEKKAAEDKAAEKEAAEEEAENEAAEEKAAANSYVKVKVEVELRGVLTCTDEAVTLSVVTREKDVWDRFKEVKWVLDFGADKALRAKAKDLNGKTVLVEGRAPLQYQEQGLKIGSFRLRDSKTVSVLDMEPKVAVKSLVAATKE
jgi:hypothetical protein